MHTCCCAVRATTWFPGANEEAASWAGPVTATLLNEFYHRNGKQKATFQTDRINITSIF
jgi:hypothetical protein